MDKPLAALLWVLNGGELPPEKDDTPRCPEPRCQLPPHGDDRFHWREWRDESGLPVTEEWGNLHAGEYGPPIVIPNRRPSDG